MLLKPSLLQALPVLGHNKLSNREHGNQSEPRASRGNSDLPPLNGLPALFVEVPQNNIIWPRTSRLVPLMTGNSCNEGRSAASGPVTNLDPSTQREPLNMGTRDHSGSRHEIQLASYPCGTYRELGTSEVLLASHEDAQSAHYRDTE